jgi:Domain of unknown function (DUF3943)
VTRLRLAAAALGLAAWAITAGPARADGSGGTAGGPPSTTPVATPAPLTRSPRPPRPPPRRRLWFRALLELAAAQAVPGAYYWSHQHANEEDWDIGWDWKGKFITFDDVRFDTNPFAINAFRHSIAGVVNYQIARTNGFGPFGASVINLLTSYFWESVVEYKELISLNDVITNTTSGISIGEPLYQLGQLWRSRHPSLTDRALTAASSPFDAFHDLIGGPPDQDQPEIWHRFRLSGGGLLVRRGGGQDVEEGLVRADLELVNDPGYLRPGAHAGPTAPGAWSRIAAEVRLGEDGGSEPIVGTMLETRTSLLGEYTQDDHGHGMFLGLATGFSYRRRRLAAEWDRLSIAHVLGPMLEASIRAPDLSLRWELDGFGDFAMVQAHVFGPVSPLPPPPPFLNSLQARGYYYAWGVSLATRLRADSGPWSLDLELADHYLHSIDSLDRVDLNGGPGDPENVVDQRLFGRAAFGVRLGDSPWSAALVLDGAVRRGTWKTHERETGEYSGGLVVQVDL